MSAQAVIQATIDGAPDEIVYDGRVHRFKLDNTKRRDTGWYVAHLTSGLPVIIFGEWRNPDQKYKIYGDSLVGDGDESVNQRKDYSADKSDWKAERTAQFAEELMRIGKRCDTTSYLTRKQISPRNMRTLRLPEPLQEWFKNFVDRHSIHDALMIPMYKERRIVDLQFITDTDKIFLPNGDHRGAYYVLGDMKNTNIVIATGFATSVSIHECTGLTVVCCFSDSNIDPVVNYLSKHSTNKKLVIAADNDIHDKKALNSGVFYSTKAAKKYHCLLAIPELNGTKVDYNDLFIALGKQAVIDSIESAVSVNSSDTVEITAAKAGELLDIAINDWLDSADHLGIKAAAGLGKSTRTIKAIVKRGLRCDYFVPSYALAIEQANRLPVGVAIAIRGRSHKIDGENQLCAKWEAAELLQKMGLPHLTMPLLCGKIDHKTGKRPCPYAYKCEYLKQFNSTAPIRFYAHEYLSLDSTRLTNREIDVAVVDETFHDALEKNSHWLISDLMQHEPIYRKLVNAVIEGTILEMSHLMDEIDEILSVDADLETHLHPEMDSLMAIRKIKPLSDTKRKPTSFLWNCKQAMALNSATRLFVGKRDTTSIYASYTKPIKFLAKETPTLYLDASLVEGIIKTINPDCRIVDIDATRRAHITQITDSVMSTKRLLDDKDYLSSRLIQFIHAKTRLNPNGAVIAPMKWIEANKKRFPASIKFAHFGALRGLNTLEQCDWLVQIGRNQPPPHGVESITRAWWSESRLTLTGGYLLQQRTLEAKDGNGALVWVHTHADPRCREVLESQREQESLQALDRLRLIHTGKVKQIWLFSNLPLPGIVPDELATFDGLTLPGRLAEVALRDDVVITDRKELNRRYPDVFPSEDAVKREFRTWQEHPDLNGAVSNKTLIRDRPIYQTCSYRVLGQPGKAKTAILPYGDRGLAETLAAIHGRAVQIVSATDEPVGKVFTCDRSQDTEVTKVARRIPQPGDVWDSATETWMPPTT